MKLRLAAAPACVDPAGRTWPLAMRDAALLAWLALEGPTPRARLAALLWPDSPADAARNALRQRLFQLRRQVGIELVTGSVALALADGVTHDLGDGTGVLEDAPVDLGPEVNGWLAHVRAQRLERLRGTLVVQADAAEQARRWDEALDAAQRLLEADPLREDAHRRLMRLHYLSGDRAAALRAFDRCEQLLKDEVGTRPDAQTLQLLAQIESAALPAAPSRVVPASALHPPRLVGRAAEFDAMTAAWHGGRTLLVQGEGGLGKSRLLADFVASVGGGVATVGARPGDAALPYALLSRLLRVLLARGLQPRDGVRHELARLLPELGDAGSPPTGAELSRFVNAVEAALSQAAGEGLAGIAVDDLHLADDASAELIGSLSAQREDGPPLRWLLACRPAERSAACGAMIDELLRSHRLAVLTLAPLSRPQVRELLDSLRIDGIGGDAQAEALHRRTGGHPLYMLEAVKAQWAGEPGGELSLQAVPSVGQVILQRLGRLSPAAVKLARCAAVAGQDFSAPLAARVLQATPLDLADAWNELEAAQVLRDGGFAHDLIHEAALASVPAPIAQALHAQIAEVLEAQAADPSRIAAHWLASPDTLRAVPHLCATAQLALARFRYGEAADTYGRAATLLEQAGENERAFDTWFLAADAMGSLGDASRLGPMAARLEALAASDAQVAKAALARSNVLIEAGHVDECLRVCELGLEAARRADLREVESDLLYVMGVVCWDRREVARAVALVDEAIRLRLALPPESLRSDHVVTTIVMVQSHGTILGGAGRFAEAMARVMQAYRMAEEAGLHQNLIGPAGDLVLRACEIGDLAQALDWADRGLQAARQHEPNATELSRLRVAHANALLLAGRWGEAAAQFEALMVQEEATPSRVRADIVARVAYLHGLLGRRDLGRAAGRAELARDTPTSVQRLWIEVVLADLGEPLDAASLLERVAAVQDVGLRARLLVRLVPQVAPVLVRPLLAVTAAQVHEGGLQGQWMTLQARIAARLAVEGRGREAAEVADAVIEAAGRGITPTLPQAEFCADLCLALAAERPEQALGLRLHGEAWLEQAAGSLPAAWRENCRARSVLVPLLQQALPARARPA